MSSRFVSGGTIAGDSTSPPAAPAASNAPPAASPTTSATSTAWEKAQSQLEAERQARAAARKKTVESGSSQSLYDVLQANKEAKQAAFEEANKIKNQFRALDDDEIDFLDDVAEKERRIEEQKRRDEEFRLREFRELQKKKSGSGEQDEDAPEEAATVDEWVTGGVKKRKREKEPIIKGIKRRTSESAKKESKTNDTATAIAPDLAGRPGAKASETTSKSQVASAAAKSKISLVDYGSDEGDDD